jgi:hypothetical protein
VTFPILPAIGQTPYGTFGPTQMESFPGLHPSTTLQRGLNYMNPNNRGFVITVTPEMLGLASLPDRMMAHFESALVFHLIDVAERVIVTAQQSLVPGHGYITGRLRDSLTYRLAEHLADTGVFYDLFSEVAYYWRYVEFGHWMANGQFWPGYHYLENALRLHESALRGAVRAAFADTVAALAAEARAPSIGGTPL